MGIHHLLQLALFCESDTFISMEGFKNNSEAAVFELWENICIWLT